MTYLLALGVAAEDGGHVQVVGDDAQAPVVQQRLGNGLGGGADVEDQRAVVGNLFCHRASDAGFALGVQRLALRVAQVFHGRGGDANAAMETAHQPLLGQALHVAPHGLQRHTQRLSQLLHRGGLAGAHLFKQAQLAGIGVHGVWLRRWAEKRKRWSRL